MADPGGEIVRRLGFDCPHLVWAFLGKGIEKSQCSLTHFPEAYKIQFVYLVETEPPPARFSSR